MAGVDTSSYQLYQNQPSGLDIAGKLTALQGQSNQNRLFNQEYNSKLGLSQIYKEAIDPQTGQLDANKLQSMMSGPNSGNITLGLPQAFQNSQEAQKRNLGIQGDQLDLAQKNVSTLLGYLGPLAANPNATANDVMLAASKAINLGHANPSTVAGALVDLPSDPAAVGPWLQQRLLQAQTMQKQFDALNPAPDATPLPGGQAAFFKRPQVGSVSQVGPTIDSAPPPTTPTVDPVTGKQTYVGSTFSNNPYAPTGTPVQNGVPISAPNGAPAAPPSGVGQAAPVGGILAGKSPVAPPGVAESLTTTANANAQSGIALQSRAGRVNDNKAILNNLNSALGDFTPGPGANAWKTAGAALNRIGQSMGLQGFDAGNISKQEEFNKMAGMLAQSQFQALGGTGTDAKLDATTLTSPNSELSKMGNKGIIAMLKGNEDAIQAKNGAWQDFITAGHNPGQYGQFERQFNKAYDPRVFQTQYLTPDDNKKIISNMSKDEQKQFVSAYRTALQNGWVHLPSGK